MTKAPKRRTPKKRGPKEKRRVVSKDDALGRLRKTTRAARADFDAAHRDGMVALKDHNFAALGAAVDREVDALTRQSDAVREIIARAKSPERK